MTFALRMYLPAPFFEESDASGCGPDARLRQWLLHKSAIGRVSGNHLYFGSLISAQLEWKSRLSLRATTSPRIPTFIDNAFPEMTSRQGEVYRSIGIGQKARYILFDRPSQNGVFSSHIRDDNIRIKPLLHFMRLDTLPVMQRAFRSSKRQFGRLANACWVTTLFTKTSICRCN